MATDHNFKVKKGLHVLGSEGIYLTDTNTRLHEGSGNALRISTDSGGYVDLGSMNSGWVHMQMNKNLYILPSTFVAIDGNLQPYIDSQRTLGANDKRWSHIYGDALTIGGAISSGAITSTGAITGAQDFKATGNNMKLHAGGNHIINIDLNGNFYPQTHNAVDLGFSDTLAFRNLHLVGAMSGGASIASGNITATGSVTAKGSSGGFFYAEDTTAGVADDDLIGGFLFKSNDTSGTQPHYAGMTARAQNVYGALQLEFFADRADYEDDTPGMVFKANGTDSTGNTLDLLGSTQITNATSIQINATNNTYNFKAFGQDTDSFFGVYDDANNSANVILTRSDGATIFQILGHTGTTTLAGSFSAESLIIDSATAVDKSGNYMIFYDGSGAPALYAGNTSDNRNYYQSNHHRFRSDDSNTNFGEISATGWHIGGTTTPNAKLDVSGDVYISDGQVWDATTQGQGKGSIHIDPNSTTDHAGGAITFGASDHSSGTVADAGIYVRSDGSYGTKMYLATTDSYATGSKTSVFIDHAGHTAITRGHLKMGTSTVISSNRDISNIKTLDVDPDANGPAFNIGRYTGQPNIKAKSDDGGYLIMDSNGGWAALNWYTANNVALCQGGGNVGIGTTSVSEKLHVSGNIRASGTVRAGAVTYTGTDGTAGQVLTTDGNGGTSFTTVSGGSGKVDIGSGFAANRILVAANSDTAQADANFTFNLSNDDFKVGNTVVNPASGFNNQKGFGYEGSTGHVQIATTANDSALTVGKNNTNNGSIITVRKQGTIIGTLGVEGGDSFYAQGGTTAGGGMLFHGTAGKVLPLRNAATIDATIDLGQDSRRFKDAYFSGNIRSGGMIVGANEAFDTTNLALHVHGHQAIERNYGLFLGVTGTNYNSWQAKLHNSGSTFYLNAQTFQFDNTGYGSSVFFVANSSGLDIRTGGLRIGNTDFVTSTKNIHGFTKNFATSIGWRPANSITSQTGYYGGNFTINGSASENNIEYTTLPDGSRGICWNTPSNDTTSNADGGWNKTITGLPSDDLGYMSVVYVRRNGSAASGNFYHGCDGSHTLNTSGSANTNPYFISPAISTLPQDVWCVSIGYVRANSDGNTSTTSSGGVYRCDTGERIHTNTDFKMKDGSTQQVHRTYLYYATNTAASLTWAKPGFYAMDGTEPAISELIRPGKAGVTFNDLVRINSTNNDALYINGNGGGLRFQGGNNRIYFNGYRALEGATDGGTLQIGENYSLALLQASNTQLKSGAKLYFHGGTTYGIGAGGHNLNSGYFDTVESGINGDTLELCYYSGEGVRVGTAAAHKYLYAGAIRSYAQSASWDANLRLYSSDGTNYWNILCDNGVSDTLRFAKNNNEKFRLEDGRTYSPQFMQVGDATAAGYATNDGSWGARLNVADSVHSKIEVSQEANSMRSLWYAHTGHDTVKFGVSTNHGLEILTDNTTRINISNTGLIDMTGASQINLTDGYEKVTINGNQFLSYGAGSHLWLISNAGAANSSRYVELVMGTEWDWDDQIQMRYIPAASGTAGGVFRLGQTSKNSATYNHTTTFFYFNGADRFKFENDGDFIATGNVTAYGSTSDIRLKENIEVIADPIEKVCKLKGITFNYKEDGKRSTGLIAQDLEQVLPEAVYETEGMEKDSEDTYKAIRYGNVVGLLVEAIKEQQQQIDSLKEEINILKGEK